MKLPKFLCRILPKHMREVQVQWICMTGKMISQEELDLFTELQPFFRERMGGWQVGDMYFCPRHAQSGSGLKRIESVELVEWESGAKITQVDAAPCCPDIAIWLSLPIDPVNPERGLWGMLKGNKFFGQKGDTSWVVFSDTIQRWCNGNTPTLALLRAIKAQI